MMIALILAAVLGGESGPAAAFEADGVRVDGKLVVGASLSVHDAGGRLLLVSGAMVEPLSGEISLTAEGRTLTVAPGVRVTRTSEGYVLGVHGRKRVAVTVGGERHALLAPVAVKPAQGGWDLGSGLVRAGQGLAAAPDQDDVDSNLNKLNQSSQKIQKTMTPPPPAKKDPAVTTPPPGPAAKPAPAAAGDPNRSGPRLPFNRTPSSPKAGYFMFYSAFNPFVSAQAVSSEALRASQHVSPLGP